MNNNYEDRYIAFIDLLGFGKLVEKSAFDANLPHKIFSALLSIQDEAAGKNAYAAINYELVPKDKIEEVEAFHKEMMKVMQTMFPVTISYFSDSLVLSAKSDDVITSQLILDLLMKLSIKLWDEHSLLIRGGITKGMLIHHSNGPLFGPAMNRAYQLESKLAVHPRILIDKDCYLSYQEVDSFSVFESFFENDGEFHYASLGTAYRHLINDSSIALAGEDVLKKFRTSLSETPKRLIELEASFDDDRVKQKYQWLLSEVEQRTTEVHQPYA